MSADGLLGEDTFLASLGGCSEERLVVRVELDVAAADGVGSSGCSGTLAGVSSGSCLALAFRFFRSIAKTSNKSMSSSPSSSNSSSSAGETSSMWACGTG